MCARFGIGARLMASDLLLGATIVVVGTLAISSFEQTRRIYESTVQQQLAVLRSGEDMKFNAGTLSRLAPELFAKGSDQKTLLESSLCSYKEQSHILDLISELRSVSEVPMEPVEAAVTKLMTNLDAMATTLFAISASPDRIAFNLSEISQAPIDAAIPLSGKGASARAGGSDRFQPGDGRGPGDKCGR